MTLTPTELAQFYLERGLLDDRGMAFKCLWMDEGRKRSQIYGIELTTIALELSKADRPQAVDAIEHTLARMGEFTREAH